jgi:hypothetical protein
VSDWTATQILHPATFWFSYVFLVKQLEPTSRAPGHRDYAHDVHNHGGPSLRAYVDFFLISNITDKPRLVSSSSSSSSSSSHEAE